MEINVCLPGTTPFDQVRDLGVAITRSNFGYHVAILFKVGERPPAIYHLAFHKILRLESPDDSYVWLQSQVDEPNRQAIALAVAAMADRREAKISYSPLYEGIYFEDGNLRYTRGKAGEGLTCATFIMAIFSRFGIELLDKETWEVRASDELWQKDILNFLERWGEENGHADISVHVEAIRARPVGVRFRPEEVAAGGGSANLPIDFNQAQRLGAFIVGALPAPEGE